MCVCVCVCVCVCRCIFVSLFLLFVLFFFVQSHSGITYHTVQFILIRLHFCSCSCVPMYSMFIFIIVMGLLVLPHDNNIGVITTGVSFLVLTKFGEQIQNDFVNQYGVFLCLLCGSLAAGLFDRLWKPNKN